MLWFELIFNARYYHVKSLIKKPVTLLGHPSIYTNIARKRFKTRLKLTCLQVFQYCENGDNKISEEKIIFSEQKSINNWRGVVLQIYWSFFSIAKALVFFFPRVFVSFWFNAQMLSSSNWWRISTKRFKTRNEHESSRLKTEWKFHDSQIKNSTKWHCHCIRKYDLSSNHVVCNFRNVLPLCRAIY